MAQKREILTAAGTVACALAIGFFMQSSEAAEKRYGTTSTAAAQASGTVKSSGSLLEMHEIFLTSAEFDTTAPSPSSDAQVIKASAPNPLPTPPAPDTPIAPTCEITANARPMAAAMVNLTLDASCLPEERVTVHHNGMIFTEVTSKIGTLDIAVPALTKEAVFILAFSNGEGAVAQTTVEDLVDFDRVVLQWKGDTGFQIHALEFGADYGGNGHIWEGAPGEMADAVTGSNGIITRHGDSAAPEALVAEAYTFPKAASGRAGTVALSVETEVSSVNCGLELEAQTIEIANGNDVKTRNLSLPVPECDSVGDFLVLNNLLEDLKVAAR
ncbi:hypothetical protein [Sulfitobacter aestuariivivens]|uniref:Translocase n=1 Tax=Sulfitobacter aestuariivivens TaxID=2766981 RepID=A0A927D9N5_9RHOB|nr:hypothetical protein [Sulfitobacter aestuariivivens]MBD3665281.1 hypothetical protein [Sulfitobacter aestuariivivens]